MAHSARCTSHHTAGVWALTIGMIVAMTTPAVCAGDNVHGREAAERTLNVRDGAIEEAKRDELTSVLKVSSKAVSHGAVMARAFDIARSRGTPYFIKLKEWTGEGARWYLVGFSTSREVVATEYFGLREPLPEGIERQFIAVEDFAPTAEQQETVADSSALPSGERAAQYLELITRVANETRVEAALLHAVVAVESGYNPQAKSNKGASGLMQLMPGTAARYGVADVWNPLQNLRGGARYLRDLLVMFADNLPLALAAYNAGEGAVTRAGNRVPQISETVRYIPKVLSHYERYRAAPRQ